VPDDFSERRVIVTGGATGVGAALLDLLAERGAVDVTVVDVKAPSGPYAPWPTWPIRPSTARLPRSRTGRRCSTTRAWPTPCRH
jgi:NAD(P)-dependent dehydrogenase (short-subunit alcohol dehydrogenase family)